MNEKITITDAKPEDFELLQRHKKEFDLSIPTKKSLKGTQLLIARKGNTFVGFMQLKTGAEGELVIRRLAVREEFRSQGIGKKLVGVARSIAINEKRKIALGARANYKTINFWRDHAKFHELPNEEMGLSKEFEIDPKQESNLRRRKPKGILKFLETKNLQQRRR